MSSTAGIDQAAMSEALERGEQFTRIFVQPMVAAMQTRMDAFMVDIKTHIQPVVDGQSAQDSRLDKLEQTQKKALIGWGAFATVAAGLMSYAWTWVKGHFKFS